LAFFIALHLLQKSHKSGKTPAGLLLFLCYFLLSIFTSGVVCEIKLYFYICCTLLAVNVVRMLLAVKCSFTVFSVFKHYCVLDRRPRRVCFLTTCKCYTTRVNNNLRPLARASLIVLHTAAIFIASMFFKLLSVCSLTAVNG